MRSRRFRRPTLGIVMACLVLGCGKQKDSTEDDDDAPASVASAGGPSSSSEPASFTMRKVGNCPLFSDQYLFNRRVDDTASFAVLPNSAAMIANIGRIGYPPIITTETPMFRLVDDSQPLTSLTCDANIAWCKKSSMIGGGVSVPYPSDLEIAKNTDAHTYVIHETDGPPAGGVSAPVTSPALAPGEKNCYLYETWHSAKSGDGFTAGGLSVYDMRRDVSYVPKEVAGSSASNLPVALGVVRYDEAITDSINHALMFAVPLVRFSYVAPANTAQFPQTCNAVPPPALKGFPCDLYNVNLPPMGQRLRLQSSFDETPYAAYPITLAFIHAMKRYGLIITDGSLGDVLKADTDPRWQQHIWPDMQALKTHPIPIEAFEALESGDVVDSQQVPLGIQNNPNSDVYN